MSRGAVLFWKISMVSLMRWDVCVGGCDEMSGLPVNLVVLDGRVLHTMADFSKSPRAPMCSDVRSILVGEIPSCFPDVDLATFTWNTVYSSTVTGIRFHPVGGKKTLKFVLSGVIV